tara:strand:+ start:100 stop:324 length:225 start_codon:yes stop_codon:yes gene_type:complete
MRTTEDKIENIVEAFSNSNQKAYKSLFDIILCEFPEFDDNNMHNLALNIEYIIRESLTNKFEKDIDIDEQITIN